jgi:hydrogenase nickel incorporation protein HypA/HybF
MHELAVTENLLNIALLHASQAGASKITDIQIVIGDLSSIIDDSVQFYWDITAQGTIAEGAQLHFKRLRTVFHCLECNQQFTPGEEFFYCPACQSQKIKIIQGKEFFLESIQIESPANA